MIIREINKNLCVKLAQVSFIIREIIEFQTYMQIRWSHPLISLASKTMKSTINSFVISGSQDKAVFLTFCSLMLALLENFVGLR